MKLMCQSLKANPLLKSNIWALFAQCSKLILLIVLLIVFVPFSPKMPSPGLDPSWALGLNQAVAQGLSFGKNIIFTLGPYSSIYTKAYHPATDLMMISGSMYLAVFYWIGFLFLAKNVRWYWILGLCIVFLGMIYSRDSLFFSYPLLVGLLSYKILHTRTPLSLYFPAFFFFLFAPFGLLALIKASMLILCLIIIILCFAFFIMNQKPLLALISLVSPTISMVLFWQASGQFITYLPDYLLNTFSIASSFTQAMSSNGERREIVLYLLVCILIFLFIYSSKKISTIEKIFLLNLFFIFLFISFKAGFTRHFGHAFIPGTSILLASIFLFFLFNSVISFLLVFASLSSWYYINGNHTNVSICTNFLSTYSSAAYGIKNRIQEPSWLKNNFAFTMTFLRTQAAFPILKGTTDIYSYDQTYLIASQNIWSPRPIFQSYSVFSPALAQKNQRHLQGKYSPDNIIFKIEPIDKRLPSLEDGGSWQLLLKNYHIRKQSNGFLFLQKKKNVPQITKPALITHQRYYFEEVVDVSQYKKMLFVRLEIKPTVWGRLVTLFFKPSQLKITLNLENGAQKHYRLTASMAKTRFLLSPLIEDASEFSLLYEKHPQLKEKTVHSLVIINEEHNGHWNPRYTLHLG